MSILLEKGLTLNEIDVPGYEKVIRVELASVGLSAIISIHTTSMGPALGGTRMFPYANFNDALNDVLRLSKGMTYKSALAETGWGGGKSVIIADPTKDKTESLLLAFGQAVELLKGDYICAEDSGTTPQDMSVISQTTAYVVGLPHAKSSGNPSPYTAWGTYRGIQSSLKKKFGSESVLGKKVAIQGLGCVGSDLADILFWHGAQLIVTDLNPERCQMVAKRTGASIVSPEAIFGVPCDVFSPCAMGGVINEHTIAQLRCAVIAGAANNQLLVDVNGEELRQKGILYAPDFVINAGGLINVTQELESEGYHPALVRDKVDHIFDQLMVIYDIAEQNGCSTHQAAIFLGNYRLKYKIGRRQMPPCFHHSARRESKERV